MTTAPRPRTRQLARRIAQTYAAMATADRLKAHTRARPIVAAPAFAEMESVLAERGISAPAQVTVAISGLARSRDAGCLPALASGESCQDALQPRL